jgi:NitT/TauT family transport system substrate-binding protein
MKLELHRLLAAAVAAATLMTVAACGDGDKPGNASPHNAADKVNYMTGFGLFGREAYAYVALEKGYFRDAGIEVSIKPGISAGENLKLVVSGQVDFTPVDLTTSLIQAGQGASDFTVIAAIHQRTLTGIMSLEGKGITSPKDLEGKTVGDVAGGVNTMLFATYAKLAGVDASKVKFQQMQPQQLPGALAAGSVDAIGQFVVGKPTVEKVAAGKKAVLLSYSDYLTDLYGNCLTTSKKLARENPDLVKRFRDALLKGLEYAINNPAEAAKILVKYQPGQNEAAAAAELALMAAYSRSSGSGVPVGALEGARVARAIALLQGAGAMKAGVTPEQVVSFDLVPKS